MVTLPQARYTLSEAARLIGVNRTSIYRLMHEGKIAAEKDESGALRISPHEVYAYLKGREEN